jgi:nucleoid-associated protein YgaU
MKNALAGLIVVAAFMSGCVWLPLQPASSSGPIHVSMVHEVQPGETLEDIAQRYDSTPTAIASVNQLTALDTPPPGTELRIPRKSVSPHMLRDLLHKPTFSFLERTQFLGQPSSDF